MISSVFKKRQLHLEEDPNNSFSRKPSNSCHLGKTQPLNEVRANAGIFPILPKKKENKIRVRQLQALRQKENKIIAFYFYQKSLSCKNQQKCERKMSLGCSRLKNPTEKILKNKNARSINHYSFMQMKNIMSEKSKYINQNNWQENRIKKVFLS